MEFHKGSAGLSVGFGVHPPTNAVVGVSYTRIGIVIGQNPTTQTPDVTLGYDRGSYYRIPVGDSNQTVVPMQAGISTTQNGFSTTINEQFSTGLTNIAK